MNCSFQPTHKLDQISQDRPFAILLEPYKMNRTPNLSEGCAFTTLSQLGMYLKLPAHGVDHLREHTPQSNSSDT